MKTNTTALKTKLKDLRNQLPYLPRAVALVWQAALGLVSLGDLTLFWIRTSF